MKRLGLAAATIILAVACVSQPASPESEPSAGAPAPAIKEPVRKERTETYQTPVPVTETIMFADGIIDRVITLTYDEGYTHLLSTTTKTPSATEPVERSTFEYSGDALTGKSTYGKDGTLQASSEYEYQDGGQLVRETIRDGKGVVQSISEWTWDNGRKSTWRVLSSTGLVLATTEYFYEGDSMASAKLFDGSGVPKGTVQYAYGTDEHPVSVEYFSASGASDGRIEYTLERGLVVTEA
ncbi:MAG: hypothetical protein JXM71_01035, partial [Spirochaetales bacterium]|nr:hypothetical protein [Spirochaetales bacterium]